MSPKPAYGRILLKLSGESLAGADRYGISAEVLKDYASEIKSVVELGVQVGVVVGGGNIFRGISEAAREMDRVSADYMGMLAPSSMPWPCRMPWKIWGFIPGFRPLFPWSRWLNRLFGGGLSDTWKREELSFLQPEPEIPILQPIRQRYYGPWKLKLK